MKQTAPILVCLAGILWGTMGIFVRQYNELGLGSMEIVAVRAVVTVVMLFIFLLIYNRKLLRIHIRDLWCFLGTGLCSILFFNFCYFKAITMTSLSVAAVLLYTAPAIVMVLSRILFQEKLTWIKVLALVATFLGCVLVTGVIGSDTQLSVGGILVGLGAGLGYALYSIFSRYALERGYHSFTISFYTFLIASAGVMLYVILNVFLPVLPSIQMGKAILICVKDGYMLGFTLLFGLVSTVLPYILYTIGLTVVENGKASIIASIEPVVATVLGVVFFHEKLTWNGVLGILLVLGAIIMCNTKIKSQSIKCKKNMK